MQEIRRRKAGAIWLRAAVPKYARGLALVLLAAGLVAVGVSYWRLRGRTEFRMISGPAQLSTEVVGEIKDLEHREMKGDKLFLLLRASRDVQFSDGHHELENVHIEVYPEKGDHPDTIKAQRTVTTEDNKHFVFATASSPRARRSSTTCAPRPATSPRPSASSARTCRAAPTAPCSTRRTKSSC